MFSKKGPPGDGGLVPSDAQSREKLVLYVYEYLLHMGAKQAATTFLQEIRWDKSISTVQEPPGFLHSWWSVFWDLYCAAPERRDSHHYSTEAKTFHDFGFVNSGYAVNGLHGPNPAPSPLGLPPQGPDGMQPGSAGMGPPHPGFFAPPVPGPHMRPSPPQQGVSQPSPHGMINQNAFINARYQGPRGGPGVRLGQEVQPPFVPGPGQPMFPDQVRGGTPHLMPPQRMPPGSSHHQMRAVGPNGFPGMRPNMGSMMGPGMPSGPPNLQRSWSGSSVHFLEPGPGGQFAPPMSVSNGPAPGGPGTPIMRSPQSLPDGSGPDRFSLMQVPGGPPMGGFPLGPEPAGVGSMSDILMNGDGLDIKHSPASTHGGLNGGTPGPGGGGAGPNSVPPSTSGESCSLDYMTAMHSFQASDHEAEIQKIKDSICEESRRFESGKDSEPGGDFYMQ